MRRVVRAVAATLAAVLTMSLGIVTAAIAVGAGPASAAAGPFSCSVPTDYYSGASATGTTLYQSPETSGAPAWTPVGATSVEYNALGLSPLDGYLYAIAVASNELIRVASDGSTTNLGPVAGLPAPTVDWATGAFDPSGNLWVVDEGDASQAYEITVSTTPPHVVTQLPLVGSAMTATDWTYDFGSMWGLDTSGFLDQVSLVTGVVTRHTVNDGGAEANAAWTYANGDLGFEAGTSGEALRISGVVTQAFTVTVYSGELSSSQADGTSCWPALVVQPTLPGGTYGSAYSQQVIITGGAGPYTVVPNTGTPPGLTLSPAGTLSGTPTAAGTFTFGVSATDTASASGIGSVTVTIAPAPLTITASSGTMTYQGNVPVITPSYSGFVNGDTASVFLKGPTCKTTATSSSPVGTYPSTCTGVTDPNYAISFVNGIVQVDLATLTVTASSASISYGDPTPVITPSYSGFLIGDSAASLTTQPTCTTTAPGSGAPAGTYGTICGGAADSNYDIVYVSGTLSVGQGVLVVTAPSPTMTYGGIVPPLEPTYSGFVNGDGPSSLTTPPTCTTTAKPASSVGGYSTTCSGAADPNYQIEYVSGTMTVNPAPLTATATSGTTTYGSDPPAINAFYSGFVNGDTPMSLSTPPICNTAATSSSPVGSYPSSCGGAVDPNYAISYVAGNVAVNPAPLGITATGGQMTYGGSAPAINATYSGFVNGDTSGSLSSQPVCSTPATPLVQAGSYPSFCQGAADPNYTISYTPGTVTVAPAALTATASSGSMTYGGTAPAINATYAGFVNGDTTGSLTTQASCSTAATSSSAVGTYPSSCNGAADPNYTITYVSGTVSVGQGILVVTASTSSMTYGGTTPAVTASYSGFVNGDTASSLTSQPTCTTTATSYSAAGSYPSNCTGAADSNYQIQYVNGVVTVNPAPLTITASSATMVLGTTPPAITASYSGFVNGDTASSLTTPPACAGTATSSSPVGQYPATCSGAADPNYTMSYAPGVVTVAVVKGCATDQYYGTGPNDTGVNWASQNLQGASLAGANLTNANLENANLQGADLEGATLTGAILLGANLQNANLKGAILNGASLANANAQNADMSCDNLVTASMPKANLQNTSLANSNLNGANLSGANMQYAKLKGASLVVTNLNAGFLQNADLTSADLTGATTVGAKFSGTIWSSTICPDGSTSTSGGGTCAGHF